MGSGDAGTQNEKQPPRTGSIETRKLFPMAEERDAVAQDLFKTGGDDVMECTCIDGGGVVRVLRLSAHPALLSVHRLAVAK